MNTPTPETDAFIEGLHSDVVEKTIGGAKLADFARKLERERDELREILAAAIPWMVKGEESGAWKHTCLPKAGSKVLQQMRNALKDVKSP